MSYASEVKKELTNVSVNRNEAKEELRAIVGMNGILKNYHNQLMLTFPSENPTILKRIYNLLLQFYNNNHEIESKITLNKSGRLRKKQYLLNITGNIAFILRDLNIFKNQKIVRDILIEEFNTEDRMLAYLRGAFLAGGSINNPATSHYHLEIYSYYKKYVELILKIMRLHNLSAKIAGRRKGSIVYLKDADQIGDFLNLIGANDAMLNFEDKRVLRDMRNSVNRLVNCENANMDKVVNASTHQIKSIKYIKRTVGLNYLPSKLKEVAITRLYHQELSLKELGQLVPNGPISKSGINHRLRKINLFANNLKEYNDIIY